jgi:ribosomal-protein-alanine N-acetyltransferase
VIVAAGPIHATAMAAVHAGAFPPSEVWRAEAIAGLLAMPGTHGLLDQAGGMAMLRVAADEAELLTLGVDPAFRRRGVGARLLAAAMARAVADGASAMLLEVAEGNAAARTLYAQAGFAEVGRRRRYYPNGEDALLLRAALTPCGSAMS